jgi:hypothetical protein
LLLTFLCGSLLRAQNGPKIKHVLVISIDGMHSQDLTKWAQAHPTSALASLAATGVNYPNAFTTKPSDSIPATIGMFTGASPALAGMYYDDAFHRGWAPAGSDCTKPGTVIDLKDGVDATPVPIPPANATLNPSKLPLGPAKGCTPVYPHNMLRVNTIFEVVRGAGMYTAYSEKRPSYDFLNGPSGKGVQDLYTPEIAAVNLLNLDQIEGFDQMRVNSILNEVRELNHDGSAEAPIPALFGMNFQSVNSAKKSSPTSGYLNVAGDPDANLVNALTYVDGAIGSIVSALREQGLLNNTGIVITAKHGESPLSNQRTIVLTGAISNILSNAINAAGTVGIRFKKITQKTSGLIWLTNQADTAAAVTALRNASGLEPSFAANLREVLSFGDGLPFPDPTTDPAAPDIVVVMNDGVNFEPSLASTTFAEHGGFGENETHVPLLVSFAKWSNLTQMASVSTRQVAPTVLAMLGLNPRSLQAVQIEGVVPLADVVSRLQ